MTVSRRDMLRAEILAALGRSPDAEGFGRPAEQLLTFAA